MTTWEQREERKARRSHHVDIDERLGQAKLTEHEKERLPLGNQYTDRRHKSICKWRCVKAAAIRFDVSDWTSKVDSSLTYQENIELMRQQGTGVTMRDIEWVTR